MRNGLFSNLKYKTNRKASVADGLGILLLMFTLAISSLFGYAIFDQMRDNGFFTLMNVTAVADFEQDAETAFTALDFMGLFFFVGVSISSIIGALLIRSHPAFFFISVIVLMITVLVAVVFSNFWDGLVNFSEFSDAEAKFTNTGYVMSNLPLLIVVVVFLIAIAMYAINPGDD